MKRQVSKNLEDIRKQAWNTAASPLSVNKTEKRLARYFHDIGVHFVRNKEFYDLEQANFHVVDYYFPALRVAMEVVGKDFTKSGTLLRDAASDVFLKDQYNVLTVRLPSNYIDEYIKSELPIFHMLGDRVLYGINHEDTDADIDLETFFLSKLEDFKAFAAEMTDHANVKTSAVFKPWYSFKGSRFYPTAFHLFVSRLLPSDVVRELTESGELVPIDNPSDLKNIPVTADRKGQTIDRLLNLRTTLELTWPDMSLKYMVKHSLI